MAVESALAELLRSCLRDDGRLGILVDRLWDAHRRHVLSDFLLVYMTEPEHGSHHIYDWEQLLFAYGTDGRYEDLRRYLDLVRAEARPAVQEEPWSLEEFMSDAEGRSDAAAAGAGDGAPHAGLQ